MPDTLLKPGDQVRHPSRGVGTVSTLIYNPLTKCPTKAWCEFSARWGGIQKHLVYTEDLTPVERTPEPRPALRLVDDLPPVVA